MNIMATPFASIVPRERARSTTPRRSARSLSAPGCTRSRATRRARSGPRSWRTSQLLAGRASRTPTQIDFKVGVDDNAATVQEIEAGTLDLMGEFRRHQVRSPRSQPTRQYKDQVVTHTLVDTDYLFFDTQQPASAGPLGE